MNKKTIILMALGMILSSTSIHAKKQEQPETEREAVANALIPPPQKLRII